MSEKFIRLNNGQQAERAALVVSTGVADANRIVATDGTGKLDTSVLPTGIGADVKVLASSENLTAGDLVNIWNDAGTPKVRKADNSNNRRANGFVITGVTAPANATVYFEGTITGLSGLTGGAPIYLGTSGAATATPPTAAGSIVQEVGVAVSATEVSFEAQRPVLLA